MYDCHPAHQNNLATRIVVALFFLSAACFVTAALVPAYPVIWQTVGVCLFVPILQIFIKYIMTRYLYRLCEREGGGYELRIFLYRGGAKMQLVCRVALCDITDITPLGGENRKPASGVRRERYCPDLAPATATVLGVCTRDEEGESESVREVLFCPDPTLLLLIAEKRNAPVTTEQ